MKTYKFKTNINCSGCIDRIKPYIDGNTEIMHWEVDTSKPDKILAVETEYLSSQEIESIIKNAGYKAVAIN